MRKNSSSDLSQKSRAPVIFVGCFLFAVLLLVACFLMVPPAVIVRGEIEATQVDLAIQVAGRLQDKKVKIGDRIKRGDQLLTLINPALEAKLVQAMAESNIAEIEMQKVLSGARTEDIEQQLKTWKRAKAISEQARRNFDRAKQAQAGKSAQLEQTFQSLQKAYNLEQAAAADYEKAVAGNLQEEKDVAIARAAQAKALVLQLQENLKDLKIIAPIDGEVSDINIDLGELASPGAALLTIVDLTETWMTANLREEMLVRFRIGESFRGKVPALGGREIEFKITSISSVGDFPTWNAADELDSKTFEVRAVPIRPIEGLRPGMSVLFDARR